jgi:hypothetical protein
LQVPVRKAERGQPSRLPHGGAGGLVCFWEPLDGVDDWEVTGFAEIARPDGVG